MLIDEFFNNKRVKSTTDVIEELQLTRPEYTRDAHRGMAKLVSKPKETNDGTKRSNN